MKYVFARDSKLCSVVCFQLSIVNEIMFVKSKFYNCLCEALQSFGGNSMEIPLLNIQVQKINYACFAVLLKFTNQPQVSYELVHVLGSAYSIPKPLEDGKNEKQDSFE